VSTPDSTEIDAILRGIGDWRGDTLQRARELILAAHEDVTETIKWRKPSNPAGVPTYECDGIICTLAAFKDKAKITFGKGALLEDPRGVFNASLGGRAMRAIDLAEGDRLDAKAFKALVRRAVALNREG
jgi:hypothetical protein